MSSRIDDNLHVAGRLSCTELSIPAATVVDSLNLEFRRVITYSQANGAASDETRVIHNVCGTTGTIVGFKAGSIAKAVGDSTVTVDLKKNGTTVLSGVITLDNANTAYLAESGTVTSAGLAVGDTLTIVIDATIGTGTLPTGVFVTLVLDEDAD